MLGCEAEENGTKPSHVISSVSVCIVDDRYEYKSESVSVCVFVYCMVWCGVCVGRSCSKQTLLLLLLYSRACWAVSSRAFMTTQKKKKVRVMVALGV